MRSGIQGADESRPRAHTRLPIHTAACSQGLSRKKKRPDLANTQTTLADVIPDFPLPEAPPQMQVRKRNGGMEPVDVNKIVKAVQRSSHGLVTY